MKKFTKPALPVGQSGLQLRGLITADELKRLKKEQAEKDERRKIEVELGIENDKEEGPLKTKPAKKKTEKKRIKLAYDEEDEEDEAPVLKKRTVIKNPKADTGGLKTKGQVQKEKGKDWENRMGLVEKQKAMKLEPFVIRFVFYDGTQAPGQVTVKKGDPIWQILARAQRIKKEFHRLSVDDMMLVVNNLIIPHNYELFWFLDKPVRTKMGNLFDQTEADSTTNTKVVSRLWFERNKHVFPATLWKEFDPTVDYSKQVLRDKWGEVLFEG